MKVTKSYLRQLIEEELKNMHEGEDLLKILKIFLPGATLQMLSAMKKFLWMNQKQKQQLKMYS
jgi:hypothetical protein